MAKQHKLRALALLAVLWAGLLPVPALAAEEEPEPVYTQIEIATVQDWLDFSENCTLDAWSRDKEIVLKEDISLAGLDYQPIPSFGGRFLGNEHTISGLSIHSSAAPSGLFGETQEGAVIQDLNVSGTIAPSGDGSMVGGIVGRNRGILQNCRFDGSVTGRSRTGGLVGLNTGSGMVIGCQMSGSVTGKSMTGGIVGRNDGAILRCRSDGLVNIDSADPSLNTEELSISGLFTAAEDNSLAAVNIATDTGGICGYSTGEIQGCSHYGIVGYPHIGYNVGGIAGRNLGFLDACTNQGSVNGRRDVGGIVGQMEPYVDMVLTEDMAQLLRDQMSGLSYLLSVTVTDAQNSASGSVAQLEQIAQAFQPMVDAVVNTDDLQETARQLGAMFGNLGALSGQLSGMAAGMRQGADTLAGDLQRVIRQLNAVNTTLTQAIDAAGSIGSTDVLSDASQENVDGVTVGKALNCSNLGMVYGDNNVGGIAGSLSIEVEMDPEGDNPQDLASSLHRELQLKSILQSCTNRGSVLARRDCVGAICGEMELGLIYSCYGYGSVESESGDYVGGIVGLTHAVIRNSWAKCRLQGGSYIGGIAGAGARSETTGSSSMIADCRSMVIIPRYHQYAAAIAGGEDGDFSGNLFVAEDLAGINRLNRVGQAVPISYDEMLEQEDLPAAFRILTLDFILDGQVVSSRAFHYGDSFSADVYPILPAREGQYGTWDVTQLEDLRFDTVVTAVYLPVVSALRSADQRPDGKPVFFVEGYFREEDELSAAARSPETLESVAGAGENPLLAGFRGEFFRSRSVCEQWELQIPTDETDSHLVRYVPPEGHDKNIRLYVKTDGPWRRAQEGSFGSYRTFYVRGSTAELAVVETELVWWVVAFYALAALFLLWAVLYLLHSLAKWHRKKKAAYSVRGG